MRFVVGKVALGQVFVRVLRCSAVSSIPSTRQTHSSSACCSYQDDEGAKPVNFPNNQCSVGNRGALDGKYSHISSVLKMLTSVTKCR
jgi:hypothetical protein